MCVKTKDAMGKCIMQCKTKLGTINAACPAVIRKTGETKEKQPEENGANTSNPETTGESTTCNAACQWQRKRDHAQAELDYCNEHPGEEGCTPSDIDQLEDELDNGEGAPGNPNTDPDESGQGEDCDVLPDSPNCN